MAGRVLAHLSHVHPGWVLLDCVSNGVAPLTVLTRPPKKKNKTYSSRRERSSSSRSQDACDPWSKGSSGRNSCDTNLSTSWQVVDLKDQDFGRNRQERGNCVGGASRWVSVNRPNESRSQTNWSEVIYKYARLGCAHQYDMNMRQYTMAKGGHDPPRTVLTILLFLVPESKEPLSQKAV